MSQIAAVHARQILDSRGQPTVEVEVTLASGATGRAAVPSGASTGAFEAVELRDGDAARFPARASSRRWRTSKDELAGVLIGLEATDQAVVDRTMIELDGTANKGRLGANAILGMLARRGAGRGRRGAGCRCTATSAARRRTGCRCR